MINVQSTTAGSSARHAEGARARARGALLKSVGRLPALLWLIPCGIAAIYLGVFVAQLQHNIWLLGWNSDYASGYTVPETVVRTGTGGHTVLGPYALYVALWFGLLTARLPLHRELWEVAPTLLFIWASLTIGWSVAQIATRRAGALAVLIALVASPAALRVFMAPVAHNTVYPCVALLGAYLVWLARGDGRRRAIVVAVPLLAGVALGACLASDILLLPTGILPIALTAALACLRRDRRSRITGLSALATVVVSIPIAVLTSKAMSALGYRTNPTHFGWAPLSELPAHAKLLLEGLEQLFNGYLGGPGASGTLHAELGVACEALMAAALLTLLVAGMRAALRLILPGGRVKGSSATAEPEASSARAGLAASLHTVYWLSAAIGACGAYVFSTFLDSPHEAFYVTVIFSVAAVVPLFVGSRSAVRWLAPVGIAVFFVASLVGLTGGIAGDSLLSHYQADIEKLARTNHVTTGYAGYWDASSLTWNAHERVAVRPVFACANPNPGGADLCVFSQETVPSWYVPRQRHTFLLVEAGEFYLRGRPRGLGRPLAAYGLGPVQMYVYPYDIASRLGPPSG